MSHDDGEPQGWADRAVERLVPLLDGLGLNGTRLRWKWNRRKQKIAEARAQGEVMLRSAKGRHKMCRSCRALVDRNSRVCPECGISMADVKGPGAGRLLTNLFPGITTATSLLMLVNGFWFAMMIMAQIKSGSAPFSGFAGELIVRFGSGLSRPTIMPSGQVIGGEWWRLITPIFLHGGLLHFIFNTYVLLNIGPVIEREFGTPRFWVIYLSCGICGSMASQLPRYTNTVGASGAIMGLIGLLLVYGYRRRSIVGEAVRSMLMRLLVYSIVLSLFFNIDHLNHIGGFAFGAFLAVAAPLEEKAGRTESLIWQALSVGGVLLVLYAFYAVAAQGRLDALT